MKLLAIIAALLLLTACPARPEQPRQLQPTDTLKPDTTRRPPIIARQHRLRINPE